MKPLACIAFAFLCTANIHANVGGSLNHIVPNAYRPYYNDPVVWADTASCTIPFSKVGNLIIIRARIDSVDGNFILDTGAPNLVLNITYFRNYPLTAPDAEKAGVTGAVSTVQQTSVNYFSLGTLKYSKIEADVTNLGHLENSKGIKILGLIGVQFLKQCEMMIDYDRSVIHLHLINRKEADTYQSALLNDDTAYNTIAFDITNDKLLANIEMGGKKVKMMIDCGAETSVLDSRLPNKVFETVEITGRIVLRGSGNEKVEALQGNVKSMRMGTYTWNSLPVIITNLERTCVSYENCLGGILGLDFITSRMVGFNFVKRKMYIWK